MRTPDYSDIPLAIKPIIRDEVTVNLESDGIAEPEYMRLVESNGHEILIPAHLIRAIIFHGNNSIREMQIIKEEAKVLSNHPSHFATLDFVNGSNRTLVLEGTSASVELTPQITWATRKDEEPGWQLHIVGALDLKLMFAQWDDVDGIKKMAETIKDAKALFAMVALIDPTLASKLASRSAVVNLKKSRAIPNMEIKELRKIVEDAQLVTRSESSRNPGGFGNLPIKINGNQVKIAIRVHLPYSPVFTKPYVKDPAKEYGAQAAEENAYIKATTEAWMERFKIAIKGTDWRILNLHDPSEKNGYRNSLSDFWVTKISERDWTSLETAALAAAQITDGTPAKF